MTTEPPARWSDRKRIAREKPFNLEKKKKAKRERLRKLTAKHKKKKREAFKKIIKQRANEHRENMTPAERHLWEVLKTWEKPYACKASKAIGMYIADFAFMEQKLIVEVDGKYHLKTAQRIKDTVRTQVLESYGFQVVRFSNDDVLYARDKVIAAIKAGIKPPPVKYHHSLLLAAMQPTHTPKINQL